MTVRNFKQTDIHYVERIGREMQTPRGNRYIDHIIHFNSGAVVAYEDKQHLGFLWVMEAAS